MKEHYDRNASQPLFEIGQSVLVYAPKTKKGLSKKLTYNWFGPYRIVEQSPPVRYRLRSKSNKKVTFALNANRMKPFVRPALIPIEPPIDDDQSEPYLNESDHSKHLGIDLYIKYQSLRNLNPPYVTQATENKLYNDKH